MRIKRNQPRRIVRRSRISRKPALNNLSTSPSLIPVPGSLPVRYTPQHDPPIIPINYIFTRRIRIVVPYNNTGDFQIPANGIAASFRVPSLLSFNWHLCELRGQTTSVVTLIHLSGLTLSDSGTQGQRRAAVALRACQLDQLNYTPNSTEILFTGNVTPLPSIPTDFIMDLVVSILTNASPQLEANSQTHPDFNVNEFNMVSPLARRPTSLKRI